MGFDKCRHDLVMYLEYVIRAFIPGLTSSFSLKIILKKFNFSGVALGMEI